MIHFFPNSVDTLLFGKNVSTQIVKQLELSGLPNSNRIVTFEKLPNAIHYIR